MARGDRFPFFWPIAVTVVLAAIPAALVVVARVQAARFDEPQHRARECAVAVEVARLTLNDEKVQARRYGLPPHRAGVEPELSGVSREGLDVLLPRYLPAKTRFFLPLPPPLDCSAAFKRNHLPMLGRDIPDRHFSRLHLSRVVFSQDGSHAFLSTGSRCGMLCGSGFDTTWRLDRGRWVLESSRGTWIS
ncbi:MAG: hypothetical protein JOZ72_06055 [Alphaproteobacteria bacterium]|nr:hypothetical protein [Alphaproteobacteria bacterium]